MLERLAGVWRYRAMVLVQAPQPGWCFGRGSLPGKALAGDLKLRLHQPCCNLDAFYNLRVITNHQPMVGNLIVGISA